MCTTGKAQTQLSPIGVFLDCICEGGHSAARNRNRSGRATAGRREISREYESCEYQCSGVHASCSSCSYMKTRHLHRIAFAWSGLRSEGLILCCGENGVTVCRASWDFALVASPCAGRACNPIPLLVNTCTQSVIYCRSIEGQQ